MSLVPSLLQAVIGLDGEALVIHVGEKPYVVAPSGQVELATRALTFEAVTGILEQMLPAESRQALEEFGAIQYELPLLPQFRSEHFTVVAARGGDDVWVEVRRRKTTDDDLVPADMFETPQPLPAHDPVSIQSEDPDLELPDSAHLWTNNPDAGSALHPEMGAVYERGSVAKPPAGFDLPDSIEIDPPPVRRNKAVEGPKTPKVTLFPIAPRATPRQPIVVPEPAIAAGPIPTDFQEFTELVDHPTVASPRQYATPPVVPPPIVPPPAERPMFERSDIEMSPVDEPLVFEQVAFEPVAFEPVTFEPSAGQRVERSVELRVEPTIDPDFEPEIEPTVEAPFDRRGGAASSQPPVSALVTPPPPVSAPPTPRQPITASAFIPPPRAPEPETEPFVASQASSALEPLVGSAENEPEPSYPAVVWPISRVPLHNDPGQALSGLDRLLRVAAGRGASTLFVASKAKPSIRVNGEMQMLDEPALGPDDVESLLIELMPDRNREALRTGVGTEWVCDIADVGRVSCMSFRDHRGAGGIFRMTPMRAISAEQLGLSREIRALATESEGLVLITGPRASGKTTLLSAFVDLINRTRRVYIITIEHDIRVVHESRHSLVSQREARDDREMLDAARTALREEPDVLVVEELREVDMASLVLDAAGSGRLVIGTVPAQTATGAVEHIVNLAPADQRRQVQLALAENLRGIVAQVLVRKPGGGQMAARELLLNSSAVASLIAEGKLSQIGPTMESGRKYGMVPLNDALVACVKSGEVDAREAYRRAADRIGFLALLKRQGIDTTFVERPA